MLAADGSLEVKQLARVSCLKWKNIGTRRPVQGREVSNEKLAETLMSQTESVVDEFAQFTLSQADWDSLGIPGNADNRFRQSR